MSVGQKDERRRCLANLNYFPRITSVGPCQVLEANAPGNKLSTAEFAKKHGVNVHTMRTARRFANREYK